jgi:predicted transcriptional regulator
MKTFEFTVIASGLDHDADDFEDRFFEAGCDDATIAVARGAIILQFAREGETLEEAIHSAMADVRRAGAVVDRVEPDYLVSLSEIAERAHLTRAAVSLYAKGERGVEFPHPVARVTTESPLWDWTDVARWLEKRGKVKERVLQEAVVFRSLNNDLEEEHKRAREFASSG